jgi:hypothetical protein
MDDPKPKKTSNRRRKKPEEVSPKNKFFQLIRPIKREKNGK